MATGASQHVRMMGREMCNIPRVGTPPARVGAEFYGSTVFKQWFRRSGIHQSATYPVPPFNVVRSSGRFTNTNQIQCQRYDDFRRSKGDRREVESLPYTSTRFKDLPKPQTVPDFRITMNVFLPKLWQHPIHGFMDWISC